MRKAFFSLALAAIITGPAYSESLPLQDGEYAQGACGGGPPDINESYSIYSINEGIQTGGRYLSPKIEGQEGACRTGKITAKNSVYSGIAKCEDGGSRIRYSTGAYRFSLQIINSKSFVSKGRKYVWCAAHR